MSRRLLAPAHERLDGGDGDRGVLRLVGAVQREEEVGVLAGQPAQRDLLTRRRRRRASLTPKSLPSSTIRAPTSSARSRRTSVRVVLELEPG